MCAKICEFTKKRGLGFLVGFGSAIAVFMAVNAAMKPLSASEYCGTGCHEMDTAYKSWQASVHGASSKGLRSECINCHIVPKDKYFTHLAAKGYAGTRDMLIHLFGGEYDGEAVRQKVIEHMSNKTCLYCHVDLLGKAAEESSKEIHTEVLHPSDDSEQTKCIECHEDAGHNRNE